MDCCIFIKSIPVLYNYKIDVAAEEITLMLQTVSMIAALQVRRNGD